MAKEKLLTGCHGDCCQALAQTVLGERETERDRERERRGRSFTSRDKEKETTRGAWTINSLPDRYACTDTHTAPYYANTEKTATKKNCNGIFKSVFQSQIHKKGVNFLVFQDKKTKQNKTNQSETDERRKQAAEWKQSQEHTVTDE